MKKHILFIAFILLAFSASAVSLKVMNYTLITNVNFLIHAHDATNPACKYYGYIKAIGPSQPSPVYVPYPNNTTNPTPWTILWTDPTAISWYYYNPGPTPYTGTLSSPVWDGIYISMGGMCSLYQLPIAGSCFGATTTISITCGAGLSATGILKITIAPSGSNYEVTLEEG